MSQEKSKLIYGHDPLCGWCYGLIPALRHFAAHHPEIECLTSDIFNVANLGSGIGRSWPLFRIFIGNGTKGGKLPFAADAPI
ncbi:MAG: hypothetical protein JKY41_14620 [Rhodobacteraceae bacterium]|nr:hypothetical protein [Paracoccaceae bacterium]